MATVKLDPAKGVQIPNMTTTERNAVSSPETGALVWNTTTSAVNQYNGSAWGTVGISEDTTKLPLAGGALTGAVTTNSTFDGVDIATRDAILTSTTTTAGAALPKAGGAMTGNITSAGNFSLDVEADLTLTALSDIFYQTTSTNSTAGHHIFKSYNTEIMRIHGGSNRVGINKTAPDARLEIVSASETALHCETTVSGEYAFIAKSSSSNSTPIADFRSGSTSHLKVLADGRGLSQYTARAWLNYNGSGNSIRDSHNVTSVGDWGTGNFGIYITNGLANTNYAAVGMGQDERYLSINTGNTAPQGGRLDFECHLDNGNWSDQDRNCIVIFGDY